MQWFTMGFWRKPEKSGITFDEISRRTYDTITIFNDQQEEYRPNYQTIMQKKDALPFDWNYDNFYKELKKNINKSGRIVFEELGYSMSFFSSLDDNSSCGYSLRVGNQNEQFINAIIVDFPVLFDISCKQNSTLICDIFQRVVEKFEPFWAGVISNTDNIKQEKSGFPRGKEQLKNQLTGVHWLNYWSNEMISSLGKEKLATINNIFPNIKYNDGVLRLQEKPLNLECEVDRQYKKTVEDYLLR